MLQQCGSLPLLTLVWLFLGSGGENRLGEDRAAAAAAVQRVSVRLVGCFGALKDNSLLLARKDI